MNNFRTKCLIENVCSRSLIYFLQHSNHFRTQCCRDVPVLKQNTIQYRILQQILRVYIQDAYKTKVYEPVNLISKHNVTNHLHGAESP